MLTLSARAAGMILMLSCKYQKGCFGGSAIGETHHRRGYRKGCGLTAVGVVMAVPVWGMAGSLSVSVMG